MMLYTHRNILHVESGQRTTRQMQDRGCSNYVIVQEMYLVNPQFLQNDVVVSGANDVTTALEQITKRSKKFLMSSWSWYRQPGPFSHEDQRVKETVRQRFRRDRQSFRKSGFRHRKEMFHGIFEVRALG